MRALLGIIRAKERIETTQEYQALVPLLQNTNSFHSVYNMTGNTKTSLYSCVIHSF